MINFIKTIVVKAINFVKSLFVKSETVTEAEEFSETVNAFQVIETALLGRGNSAEVVATIMGNNDSSWLLTQSQADTLEEIVKSLPATADTFHSVYTEISRKLRETENFNEAEWFLLTDDAARDLFDIDWILSDSSAVFGKVSNLEFLIKDNDSDHPAYETWIKELEDLKAAFNKANFK